MGLGNLRSGEQSYVSTVFKMAAGLSVCEVFVLSQPIACKVEYIWPKTCDFLLKTTILETSRLSLLLKAFLMTKMQVEV